MKTIGIKLADGSFYPVLQEGTKEEKQLDLTTAHNNQTRVMVDMYRSKTCSIEDAEYVDTLQIDNLIAHPNGEADISFTVSLDENNNLFAKIVDSETGAQSKTTITLVSRTLEERLIPDNYEIKESPTLALEMGTSLSNSEKDSASEKKAVSVAAGGGLLAAAMSINKKLAEESADDVQTEDDFNVDIVEEDPTIAEAIEETSIDESELMDSFDSADIFEDDVKDVAEDLPSEIPETENPEPVSDEAASAENDFDMNLNLNDMTENVAEQTPLNADANADVAEDFNMDDLDLGEMPAEENTDTAESADIFDMDDMNLDDMPSEESTDTTEPVDIFSMDDLDLGDTVQTESEDAGLPDLSDFDLGESETEEPAVDETDVIETPDVTTENTANTAETDIFSMDDLDLGEMPAEENTDTAESADIFDIDDMNLDDMPSEESTDTTESVDLFSMDDLDLGDTVQTESEDAGLPDLSDFDLGESETEEPAVDETDAIETPDEISENAANTEETDIFSMDDLDLGEMPAEESTDTTESADIFDMDDMNLDDMPSEESFGSTESTDLFSMDDLDLGNTAQTETEDAGLPDLSDFDLDEPKTEEPAVDEIPDMSDFNIEADVSQDKFENSENTIDEDSNIFSMDDLDFGTSDEKMDDMNDLGSMGSTLVAADPFNLDGLYDTPSFDDSEDFSDQEEEVSKKTKAPVIICVICAIICILATLLVLFIIPSKYNLIGKDKTAENTVTAAQVESETIESEETDDEDSYDIPNFDYEAEEEPVYDEPEEVPQAKEDEIVIIEEAEKVMPVVPEVVEEKPADISYKIKWGDTLWDIADTYYKNPWRYKAIANYNGIKNPDHIISGTIIAIPAE